MSELSRAPHHVRRFTAPELQAALIELKARYPEWGARKLVRIMERDQGLKLALRTAEHILRRTGYTKPREALEKPLTRFEREACGMLLQMDFKGLPSSVPYSLLTVLDDHARYCFCLAPVPDKTAKSVTRVLWELFGEHGLPQQMLMDNGDCWGTTQGLMPTRFEVWLMKLGVKPIHGRPSHPQTQGKVERFHGTVKAELGAGLVQPTMEAARLVLEPFVSRYNWVRPHDALGGETPGSMYRALCKRRPAKLPEHQIPEGKLSRKVDGDAVMCFKGRQYKVGRGLIGERVVLDETEQGWMLSFNGFDLVYLHQLTNR
jgi:transposase InsO family protein